MAIRATPPHKSVKLARAGIGTAWIDQSAAAD
jgi:hypothetical protein